ncbi:MAG: HAMP domain-containing histidine kinase [Halobacteriovoraceae bacterium]|nr:HAMP domain-containing histidine kinase [Halobacteriovoraceae bacterium]
MFLFSLLLGIFYSSYIYITDQIRDNYIQSVLDKAIYIHGTTRSKILVDNDNYVYDLIINTLCNERDNSSFEGFFIERSGEIDMEAKDIVNKKEIINHKYKTINKNLSFYADLKNIYLKISYYYSEQGNDLAAMLYIVFNKNNLVKIISAVKLKFAIAIFVLTFTILIVFLYTINKIRVRLKNIDGVLTGVINDDFDSLVKYSNLEVVDRDSSIKEIALKIYGLYKSNIELVKQESQLSIIKQITHDIRSPLAALDIAAKSIPDDTKYERAIFNSAINRIHDLANDLLSKNKDIHFEQRENKKVSIVKLLNLIVSEKRLEHSKNDNVRIEFKMLNGGYEAFSEFSKKEFYRIISNLINNSVEATYSKLNEITASLSSNKNDVNIEISDTGKGIPNEYLDKIFIQGESIGKENGNGLGLFHAKSLVESFGGKINVISEIGKGTTITIRIPKIVPPESFVSQISLKRDSKIVLIEDDPSVHKAWESRFKREIKSFFTLESFKKWKVENDESGYIYIFDQEFKKESTNGLETILELGITKESILCTSHYENSEIQKTCEKSGIGLVDKSMIPYIPIIIEEDSKIRNLSILIDDDPLVRLVWKTRAKEQGIEFKCFSNEDDFYNELPNISKDSPIYIDSCLGDGVKGEDIARDLVTCGYEKVSIATGYEKERFSDLPKQIKIQGKGSPW